MHWNKGRKKVNLDWNRLLSENNIKSVYSVDVNNRFEALQEDCNDDDNNADTTYNNIITAHNEAAKMCIQKKEKKNIMCHGKMSIFN